MILNRLFVHKNNTETLTFHIKISTTNLNLTKSKVASGQIHRIEAYFCFTNVASNFSRCYMPQKPLFWFMKLKLV